MKDIVKSIVIKVLLIANGIFIALQLLSSALTSIQSFVGKCPIVGPVFSWLFGLLAKPAQAAAKLSKVVLIVDIILVVLLLLFMIIKRIRNKKAAKAFVTAKSEKKKTSALTKMMNMFH